MMINKKLKIGLLEGLVLLLLYAYYVYPTLLGAQDYVFIYPFNLRDGSIYWILIFQFLLSVSVFFANVYFGIPKYLKNKQVVKYILFIVLTIVMLLLLEEFVHFLFKAIYHLPENFVAIYGVDFENLPMNRNINMSLVLRNLSFLVLSFGYRYVKDWKELMEERNRKQHLLSEKLKVEFNYLKSQVNPHFLFNNLNNIYAITERNHDQEASEAITRLSNLLRFMLYDSNSEFISVQKEISYIQDYIEIQQLRFADEEVIVNFKMDGDLKTTSISPFLLIPFVENAFKYGVKIHQNSIIKVAIEVKEGVLNFKVKNKIHNKVSNHTYSGIGIANVKKRLDLVYANRYTLEINEDNEYYTVNLSIKEL